MPKPKLADSYNYMTTSRVCDALGISAIQLDRRLEQGVLPKPTKVADSGVRLFDENWLRVARAIMENSFGGAREEAHV